MNFNVQVDDSGNRNWFLNGELVKVEWINGNIFHYKNNKLHNDKGPAYIWANGSKHWYYLEGRLYWTEQDWRDELARRNPPIKELTVAQIEGILGFKIKIIA
jgi:hypothetical protein